MLFTGISLFLGYLPGPATWTLSSLCAVLDMLEPCSRRVLKAIIGKSVRLLIEGTRKHPTSSISPLSSRGFRQSWPLRAPTLGAAAPAVRGPTAARPGCAGRGEGGWGGGRGHLAARPGIAACHGRGRNPPSWSAKPAVGDEAGLCCWERRGLGRSHSRSAWAIGPRDSIWEMWCVTPNTQQ